MDGLVLLIEVKRQQEREERERVESQGIMRSPLGRLNSYSR